MSTKATAEQRAFWNFEQAGWKQAAGGYQAHIASLTCQSVEPLLDAAGARHGIGLLDVCTGPGHAAAAAAERGAQASGIDFSLPMIELASRRFPQARFLVGDAESLPFRDGSFGAVVSNFGLLHLSRPEQFLREAHRVLRSGGRVAFTVWAPAEEAVAFGMVHRAIQAHGNPAVPLPPGPPFFRFSAAEECQRTLCETGFDQVVIRRAPQCWRLQDADGLFQAMMAGTVRTGGLLRAQSPQALAAIRNALRAEVDMRRNGDSFELPMPAVLASAVKP